MEKTTDIDIVLLWVDGNDPEWQKEYRKYKAEHFDRDELASGNSRYQDWDNLQYVFRGIEKFMPWIRKIHFITWGHLPAWMNTNHPKLQIHRHEEIFENQNHLPTFNSNAIEFNMIGIPDLSEKFILFNDDSFVLKPTNPERFFSKELPVDYLALGFPHRGFLYRKFRSHTVFMDSMMNNIRILNRHFRKSELIRNKRQAFYHSSYPLRFRLKNFLVNLISRQFEVMVINHHPQAHLKSSILEVKRLCSSEYETTSASKFRDRNNLTQYLFRFWNLAQGKFVPCYHHDHLHLNITNAEVLRENLQRIREVRFFCPNDNLSSDIDFQSCKSLLNPVLEDILPEKSSFEI